jgi:hypothetical protein
MTKQGANFWANGVRFISNMSSRFWRAVRKYPARAVLLLLPLFAAMAATFVQIDWSGGVPADSTACTTAGGTWTGTDCLAIDPTNQIGWTAYSGKDADVAVANGGADLQLGSVSDSISQTIDNSIAFSNNMFRLHVTDQDFSRGATLSGISVSGGAVKLGLASHTPQWSSSSSMGTVTVPYTYDTPAFADLDGDGKIDMIVGTYQGMVYSYKNTGTNTVPAWTKIDSWSFFSGYNQDYAAPALKDLDGDGDYDLLIGTSSYGLIAFENSGSKTVPVWTRKSAWDIPSVGAYASPVLADLDGDGDYDLLVGVSNGGVRAYENTGTVNNPTWTRNSAWDISYSSTWPRVAVADIDGDGDQDALVSGGSVVVAYENTHDSSSPTWGANSTWDPAVSGSNISPGLGDLNGDGAYDLAFGTNVATVTLFGDSGAITYYTGSGTLTSAVIDTGSHYDYTTLDYNPSVPLNTNLQVDIRAGDNPVPDGTWTGWQPNIAPGGDISMLGSKRYVQYQISLSTTDTTATPSLRQLEIFYSNNPGGPNTEVTDTGSHTGVGLKVNLYPWLAGTAADSNYYSQGVQGDGHYAYVADVNNTGSTGQFNVFDVSNPSVPVYKASRTLPATPLYLILSGNYAYVTDGNSGLSIVDITTPTSPTVVATYDTPGRAINVQVVGNYAYIADTTSLQIIDVSNPAAPTFVGSAVAPGGAATTLSVSGNYAYVTDGGALEVFDITNKAAPTLLTTYGSGFNSVEVVGKYAYVGGSGLQILDISNPVAPVVVGSNSSVNGSIINIAGHYAYALNVNYLYVVDIADPSLPQLVSSTYGIIGYGASHYGLYVYGVGVSNFRLFQLGTYASSGYFDSSVMDAGPNLGFTTLNYTSDSPTGTSLSVDVRSGNTTNPYDGTWTAWQPGIADGGDISMLGNNRYVQYRVNLSTTDPLATPTLHEITFNFTRYAYSSSLTSSAYNSTDLSNLFDSLAWTQTLPAGTDVRIQVRTAADNSGVPGAWGEWVGPDSTSTSYWSSANDYTGGCSGTTSVSCSSLADFLRDGLNDQWFEYQITLVSSGDQTPTLSDVSLTYGTAGSGNISVTPTSGLTTTEAGGTASFDVSLTSAPTADVTIHLYSSDPSEGSVSPTTLTFTSGNWNTPQTVTVTGVDDLVDDGDIAYNVVTTAAVSADPTFNDVNPSDVSLVNTDDDTAGIIVSPTTGLVTTEAGGSDTFTVKLNSQPVADVIIDLTSSDASEGAVTPASVTFNSSNWNAPQIVTVTGVDDHIIDGNIAYTAVTAPATSSDPKYSGMNASDVAVTNNDDDVADIAVTAANGFVTSESGGLEILYVTLTSQPSANVTVGFSSSDTTEGTLLTTSLAFNSSNWNVPQSFPVFGVDDAVPDGNIAYSIVTGAFSSSDPNFNGVDPADIAMTNMDDDSYIITVNPTSGLVTSEDGGSASFTITLGAAPTADVTINLTSSDPTEGLPSPSSVVFHPGGSTVARVSVVGLDDAQIDGTQSYKITTAAAISTDPNYNGKNPADVSLINTDNELIQQTIITSATNVAGNVIAADINCDNIPDLVVGTINGSSYGYVYIYYGSSAGYSATPDKTIFDSNFATGFGAQIVGGDFNHDACGDLAIGDPAHNEVFIYYGSPSGIPGNIPSQADWHVTGTGGQFGYALAAGDFNGDGYTDLAVGEPIASNGQSFEGRVWVFLNSASGLPGTSGAATTANAVWSFESDMASGYATDRNTLVAANVNGDAYDDLIIGVRGQTNGQSNEGRVYAFYGSASGFNDADADTIAHPSDANWAAESDVANAQFGAAVANAGRINGDAYDDIVVGAPGYTNGQSNEGAIFLFRGSATGLRAPTAGDGIVRAKTENDGMVESNSTNAALGYRVNGIGDMNHDGYGDIIASAPGYGVNGVYEMIYSGSASGISATPMTMLGPNQGHAAVGVVGDINGDGYPDLYVADTSGSNRVVVLLSNISVPDFAVTSTSGLTTTESGGTASFTVALTSPPSAPVTIGVSSSNTAEGTVSPVSLVFDQSNWKEAQTVTVTGVNDAISDGPVAYTVVLAPAVSADSNYDTRDPLDVSVTNLDNDIPQEVSVTGVNSPETGAGSVTFSRSGEITADLSVDYTVSGTAVAGSDYVALSGSAVIPTGSASVTVPITAIDNHIAQGNRTVVVTVNDGVGYTAGAPAIATSTILDDDIASVSVFPAAGLVTTEAGGTASFALGLGSQPTADVTINLSSTDTTEGQVIPSSVTFTPGNWNVTQNVTVVGVDDAVVDGDIAYTISTSAVSSDSQYNGIAVPDVGAINRDDENRTKVQVIATKTPVTEGSTPGVFTVTRSGSTAADLRVFYSVAGSATRAVDYYSLPGTVTIPAGSSTATIDVGTIQDNTPEPNETVILSLAPDSNYIVGNPGAATVVISDDDQPQVPVANFTLDQTVAEGATVTVTAVLNEAASTYPVTIPYIVSGTATNPGDHDAVNGNIVINSGTIGTTTFHVVSDAVAEPAETVVFSMGAPVNANAGTRTTQTVTILESNGSPNASLQAMQNGVATHLIVTGSGQVTVTASVSDPNPGDTHSYDWSLSNAALLDINDGDPATFVFDPSALTPGYYAVRLTVTDNGSPPLSTKVDMLLQVDASAPVLSNATDSDNDGIPDNVESFKDSDGDGIPDYLDINTLASNELQLMSSSPGYIMRADPGLELRLGNVAFAAGADGAEVSVADIAAYGGGEGNAGAAAAQDTVPNTGGYFDFEIAQLPEAGQSAHVVIPQLAPIPTGATYRKYDPVTGWRDFVSDANNALASAPGAPGECPLPGDPIFTPGLTAGNYCIQLTLQDGGPNDADGLANHVIADPGKIGVRQVSAPGTSPTDGSSGNATTAGASSSGGGALDLAFLMMMFSVLIGRTRITAMRRQVSSNY